ncbi:MAG: DUF3175 domain-containing protein [Steroidobacteraceae bacterium]|nr:DUF3175 domain-containing protein [Steroidobacteraceae bacterium]
MAATRKSPRRKAQRATGKTRSARRAASTAHSKRTKRAIRKHAPRKWSAQVMRRSDALDLEEGVFKKRSAREIALSLKRSAEASRRRKAEPFRSAMSMLTFHINRGGRNLSPERRRVLNQAKDELRAVFGREAREARE